MSFQLCTAITIISCFSLVSWANPKMERSLATAPSSEKPKEMEGIGIDEKLGTQLDLSLLVTDHNGKTLPLRSFFSIGRPVILSLVYYSCPGLCNFHLNGVFEAMAKMDWKPGKEFETLAVSFDPKENSDLAASKRDTYTHKYVADSARHGVHFASAGAGTINALTAQTGFKFRWDEKNKEWAHASAAIIVSPEGKITRYLHGIMPDPKDLRLSISEASSGKVGTIVDRMIWYCFKYDPQKSKYSIYVFRIVQIGGLLMVLVLAAMMAPFWSRAFNFERRK